MAGGFVRGQPYPIELAFFGDHAQLQQLRTQMLATGYKEDTSQTDQMLVFLRVLPFDLDLYFQGQFERRVTIQRRKSTFAIAVWVSQ